MSSVESDTDVASLSEAESVPSSWYESSVGDTSDADLDPVCLTLPSFSRISENPQFLWGDVDGNSFSSLLDQIYEEVVHWRRNAHSLPFGKGGKVFVSELASSFI